MDDLIRRSDLLKKFNDSGIQITFDLPVEEVLGEDVDIDDFTMLVQDAIQAYRNMVIGTIKDMPTAYDVEKVVEEIKSQFGCKDCEYADVSPTPYVCLGECAELEVINDICDLVKRGGVE